MTVVAPAVLGQRARLVAALATWLMIVLASPGILARDGSAALAFAALVPWAACCSRPGKRAFLIEWLAAAIGLSALCIWSVYVWWGTLIAVALVPAVYVAGAGLVLRLLARRFPLALAAPAAWVGLEVLRCHIEPPFAFGWMRLGTHLHATEALAGSARVWGVAGLSFLVAAFAGGVADVLVARASFLNKGVGAGAGAREVARPVRAWSWIALAALAPLGAGWIFGRATHAPASGPGPRVMLVQPSFEQSRKMQQAQASELFAESRALTEQGLADAARNGEREPDLVAWGETMFPAPVMASDLLEAWDRGSRTVDWARDRLDRELIDDFLALERRWIVRTLLGRERSAKRGVLPAHTWFLSGVEYYTEHAGAIRRQNAVVLWDPAGQRAGVGGKVHLVPGAEALCGLERLAWVRALALSLANYVPDLVAFDRAQVLELKGQGDRRWRFAVTVCFDNSFDDPYTQPLRDGPLDFHLIASNEAWYRESFEYDQMVAFSRLIAIETGRSVVRVTNAGISIVLGPDGGEVARLSVDGRDRMRAGTLRVDVPVPLPEGAAQVAPMPPYVRFERAWLAAFIALPALLGAFCVRRPRSSSRSGSQSRGDPVTP